MLSAKLHQTAKQAAKKSRSPDNPSVCYADTSPYTGEARRQAAKKWRSQGNPIGFAALNHFPTAVGKQGGRRITALAAVARLSKRLPLWGSWLAAGQTDEVL